MHVYIYIYILLIWLNPSSNLPWARTNLVLHLSVTIAFHISVRQRNVQLFSLISDPKGLATQLIGNLNARLNKEREAGCSRNAPLHIPHEMFALDSESFLSFREFSIILLSQELQAKYSKRKSSNGPYCIDLWRLNDYNFPFFKQKGRFWNQLEWSNDPFYNIYNFLLRQDA